MADVSILSLLESRNAQPAALLTTCWNRWMADAYGFVETHPALLQRLIFNNHRYNPDGLLFAWEADQPVGFVHWDLVRRSGYPTSGVICAIAVAPECRRQGVGTALVKEALNRLREAGATDVDGGGAWPYSPFYAGLVDGSERSGIFFDNKAALHLFRHAGFEPGRESLVMERNLCRSLPEFEEDASIRINLAPRKRGRYWLDEVFRIWDLHDHTLFREPVRAMSCAIFGLMEPRPNAYTGSRYAIFGVNTPPSYRRQGLAYENLARLLTHLAAQGGEAAELHVYADNEPAVALYQRLGFLELKKTVMLKRML